MGQICCPRPLGDSYAVRTNAKNNDYTCSLIHCQMHEKIPFML
jgi:hypothetical protein